MKSPYLFLKKYKLLNEGLVRIFPCTVCGNRLVNGADGYPSKKQPCNHDYCAETSDKCYTILVPLEPQLEYFVQHYGENLKRYNEEPMKAQLKWGMYKKYQREELIDDCTLSLQLNSDAAQMWKHSVFKFNPQPYS